MRILIFGSNGLLGNALKKYLASEDVVSDDLQSVDITNQIAVGDYCRKVNPDVIINAAAYNAVDKAEVDSEAKREAFAVNGYAIQGLAQASLRAQSLFIHFSTDYVFDGTKGSAYTEEDQPSPLSVYGFSKLAGEELLTSFKDRGLGYYLIRTSRLYGTQPSGASAKKNFVDMVLESAAERSVLNFIDGEEIASPTYADDLAESVYALILAKPASGIYHRTNNGSCSWFEFARAVIDGSDKYSTMPNALGKKLVRLKAISSIDLDRPARRPKYSVLQSTKLPPLRDWSEALVSYMSHRYK